MLRFNEIPDFSHFDIHLCSPDVGCDPYHMYEIRYAEFTSYLMYYQSSRGQFLSAKAPSTLAKPWQLPGSDMLCGLRLRLHAPRYASRAESGD